MLQNKYSFNQSSSVLEVVGLPDLSKNDSEKSISIISKWKLSIINQPEIEGGVDHLKSIIKAFYSYSAMLIINKDDKLKSKLVDIFRGQDGRHNLTLKSTKPDVKPLEITLGNAELSDVINCFDQLKNSNKINIDSNDLNIEIKKQRFKFDGGKNIYQTFLPSFLSFLSISFISLISIYFYNISIGEDNNTSFLNNNKYSKETIYMVILK